MTTAQQRRTIAPIAELLAKSLEAATGGDITAMSVAESSAYVACTRLLREYVSLDGGAK